MECEYGNQGDEKGQGYWIDKETNHQFFGFIEIFDLLYPYHMMLLNIDC